MRREVIIKMETNLDHLTGEEIGMAMQALSESPDILDVLFLPGIGKKNRPSGLLQVLCHVGKEETVLSAIFRHTHTLGIRMEKIERAVLPRKAGEQEIWEEKIPAKIYEVDGASYSRPEADAVRKLANLRRVGAPALRLYKPRRG